MSLDPAELLDRIRDAADTVLSAALGDPALLVNGHLPFLALSVAWAAPMDRVKRPVGHALNARWQDGRPLHLRVADALDLPSEQSHALNDTHAAAIAFAFAHTRQAIHVEQTFPQLAIVLRLAGAVGGAIIAIEKPEKHQERGITSGFAITGYPVRSPDLAVGLVTRRICW